MEQDFSHRPAPEDGGQHDFPAGHLRQQEDEGTDKDGDFGGFADTSGNGADKHLHERRHLAGGTTGSQSQRRGTTDGIGRAGNPHRITGNH